MDGFMRYVWHRLLFNALFYGRSGSRPNPKLHNVIAVPKLVNVTTGPTDNHSRYYARVRLNLHGQEVKVETEGDTRQQALDRLSKALLLEAS